MVILTVTINATGRMVKEFILPTAYSSVPTVISWDGTDDSGKRVASGVYFCASLRLTILS